MRQKTPNLKQFNSKFIVEIVKNVIKYTNEFDHIDINDILWIRSEITNHKDNLFIYRLPRELINITGIYYVVSIQPTFDLLAEYKMYREVYHVLKHINSEYKSKPRIETHDTEMFEGEYRFNEQFRENLGMMHREKNAPVIIKDDKKIDYNIFDKLLGKEKLLKVKK